MDAMLVTIGLAFIEGFGLIISPCILPILPIILSGSLSGTKLKPYGIITGFIISFCILTLLIRYFISITHLDPNFIRNAAFFILILLGIIMISSFLTEKFNLLTQKLMNIGNKLQTKSNEKNGFWGGVIFGALIGIIWTPCAGPILAAVIVQVAIQQTTLAGVLTVIAFAIGAGIPMLLIALIGHQIIEKFNVFKYHANLFRKILGVIIIASVVYLIFQPEVPTLIEAPLSSVVNKSENAEELVNGLAQPYNAPAIEGINAWINSAPINLQALKGHVVLIDFWTYSCINCIRTLPHIKDWYAKYHNKGLIIIGIHSPEFEFEKNLINVQDAVKNYQIQYPVGLDNDYITWRNFINSYWPAHYLIDKEGKVVYQHFGEGAYDVTENNIRYLLGIKGHVESATDEPIYGVQTPETYLGYARANQFSSVESAVKDSNYLYHYPTSLPTDSWALKGKWTIHADNIIAEETGASIRIHFYAKKVFAVMASTNGFPIDVELRLDDRLIQNSLKVRIPELYTLVNLPTASGAVLEITCHQAGLEIYTFTFGSE